MSSFIMKNVLDNYLKATAVNINVIIKFNLSPKSSAPKLNAVSANNEIHIIKNIIFAKNT